jgi:biopolymer transport protein ExbD
MKLKRRKIKRGRIEIIPMIDTIVILLIFYMTFSRFVESSKQANLKLPTTLAGDDFKGVPNQVVINMFNKDAVYIEQTKYTIDEVPDFLKKLKQTDARYAHMAIVLRGDKGMNYSDLSAFMKACAKAGIADVTFTTEEKK